MHAFNHEGYSVVLMHFRGCATQDNRLPRSYHSGESGDAREFIAHLHTKYPKAQLFAIGYSLGANMLLKLLGETKEKSFLQKAVGVSAPLQLDISANAINEGLAKYYQAYLVRALNKSLERKYNTHNMESLLHIKRSAVHKLKTFWEFDAAYTAPIHGFASVEDYYKKSSAKQFLKNIQIPTLIIHALDDPFMSPEVIPTQTEISKSIQLEVSQYGGHVGFIGGSIFKPEYWLEKRIIAFFKE